MASIHKLSISGIRAFESGTRQTISFDVPLTLIVGANGSGKTTIIECLKYATTGDLPPNSKGGAFIHDPSITGEREVLAQVKVGFTSTSGATMVCTRSLQLTVKKNTRSVKTLESQLMTENHGERSTISSRCADVDKEVILHLGVSKAVLNYVIFCHQEDSLWPLSEPSVLKKKFDEIFEANRYIKALDAIKIVRKEQLSEIKLLQQEVKFLQMDCNRADKKRTEKLQIELKIKTFLQDAEMLKKELANITKQSDKLFKSNQEFQKVLLEHDRLENECRLHIESLELIKANTQMMPTKSTEELEDSLNNFSSIMQGYKNELHNLENKKKILNEKLSTMHLELNMLMSKEGELIAQETAYQRQVSIGINLLKSLCDEYFINHGNYDSKSIFVDQVDEIREKLNEDKVRLEAFQKRIRNEETSMQISYEENNRKNKKNKEEYEVACKERHAIENRIKNLKAESSQFFHINEGDVAYAKAELENLEEKLAAANNENNSKEKNWKTQWDELQINEKEVESKIDIVNAKLISANENSDSRVRIKFLKDDLMKREKSMNALLSSNWNKILSVIGNSKEINKDTTSDGKNFPAKKLQKLVQDKSQENIKDEENIEKKIKEVENKKSKAEAEIEYVKMSLESKRAEENECRAIFENIMGSDARVEDYEQNVQDLENYLQEEIQSVDQYDFTYKYYTKAIKYVSQMHCCLLCERPFGQENTNDMVGTGIASDAEKNALQTFVKKLSLEAERIPVLKKEAEDNVRAYKEDISKARDYKVTNAIGRLRALRFTSKTDSGSGKGEIFELENKLKDCEQKLKEVTEEDVNIREEKERIGTISDGIETIGRLCNDLTRIQGEIQILNSQIIEAEKLISFSTDEGKTVMELQQDVKELIEKSRKLKNKEGVIVEEREKWRKKLQMLNSSVNERKIGVAEREKKLEESKQIEKTIEELEEKRALLNEQIKLLSNELGGYSSILKNQKDEIEKLEKKNREEEREISRKISSRNDKLRQLEEILLEKKQYEEKGSGRELSNAKQKIAEKKEEISMIDNELTDVIVNQIGEAEKKLNHSVSYERQIRDNLESRKLEILIKNKYERVNSLNVAKAKEQNMMYQTTAGKLRDRQGELGGAYSGKMGEIRQMEDQIKRIEEELANEFELVSDRHREELIKLKAKEGALEDLGKYASALDNAIMRYHSLKMEEINYIIDELWKRTYSGTDVDTILIKSEEPSSGGSGNNRSYNYRVCMVKQDVELDMRGRCSAGQKVLASIIIRLALAECFGVNCGIIALDEPTTNLDRENAESLARSLSTIIGVRRQQKNFQLIVITHDEKFLNAMGSAQYTDHFYRVYRNDMQKSEIEDVPISHIME